MDPSIAAVIEQDALGCLLAIGDTSHGILPLAGLGANLGFADVLALRATLESILRAGGDRIARSVARERCVDQRPSHWLWGFSRMYFDLISHSCSWRSLAYEPLIDIP